MRAGQFARPENAASALLKILKRRERFRELLVRFGRIQDLRAVASLTSVFCRVYTSISCCVITSILCCADASRLRCLDIRDLSGPNFQSEPLY